MMQKTMRSINKLKRTELNKCILRMYCIFLFLVLVSCKGENIAPGIEEEEDSGLTYVNKDCSTCAFVIQPDEWKFDGKEMNVQPGDTVGIPGGLRAGLFIVNVEGTSENPIIFINCDGRAELGLSIDEGVALNTNQSKHFKIAGTGMIGEKYGIAVKGYMGVEISYLSTNFEIYGIEVLGAGYAGIICRSDATCDGEVGLGTFTQYNTFLHDNYVHDTGGEGFYVGGSHWGTGWEFQPGCQGTLVFEPELKGVRIYNNIVRNTGRDGIQVGSAVEDCEIYNNLVEKFGQKSEGGHMTGFQINPGTTGKLYNNVVIEGNGFGIFMTGRGDNLVFNNLIINPSYDGIYSDDRTPTPGLGFSFINNTIINPGFNGYGANTIETTGNVFYNNIVTTPGNKFIDSGNQNYDESNNIFTNQIDTLLFINPAEFDYGLTAGSPAIDAGKDVTSYGITIDLLGEDRPNGAYDIGAYEFNN